MQLTGEDYGRLLSIPGVRSMVAGLACGPGPADAPAPGPA